MQLSRSARREVQASLAEIEPRVGTVDVMLSPADAHLTVDGQDPDARDGSRLYLLAGTHRIAASAPGRTDVTRVVEVAGRSSESLDLELELARAPPAPPPAPTPAPPSPAAPEPPASTAPEPATTSPIEDTRATESPATEPISDGQPATGSGSGRAIVRWSFYGVAGVAAVSATVLGVMALGAYDDFDAGATRIEHRDYTSETDRARIDQQARDDAARTQSLALWADVSIGVAVAAAATGTVIWLTTPSPRRDLEDDEEAGTELRLAGAPMPGGGAVAVSGSF